MPEQRILTVPEEAEAAPVAVTGNEYVALPEIGLQSAAVYSLNVLHMGARGLLELAPSGGRPLLQPAVAVGDDRITAWEPLEPHRQWLPRFRARGASWDAEVEYLAPPGHRGFLVHICVHNRSDQVLPVSLGLAAELNRVLHTIYSPRELGGERRLYVDRWTRSVVFEALPGLPVLGLALRTEPEAAVALDGCSCHLSGEHRVLPGAAARLTCYLALAPEADGARVTAVDLQRRGWEELRSSTEAWLASRWADVPPPADGLDLAPVLNRNRFFNLFFATGRTIDTDELVLVTSRSPRYYVSAAHWTRDALLWSFPGTLDADPALARAVLVSAFRLYGRHPGIHSLYLDGSVLYPGFELDEWAAFFVALGRYLDATGDTGVLQEAAVAARLPELLDVLAGQRHPQVALYRTFLLPSDDPAHHPYVTYNNALVARALEVAADLAGRGLLRASARALAQEAEAIRAAIHQHAVVPGPWGPQFAWSVDLAGNHLLYDEAPGTLELLPVYGFCSPADPIWRNTVAWIYSPHNPYHIPSGAYASPGCPHVRHPWVLTWCSALLRAAGGAPELPGAPGLSDVLRWVATAPMDGGLACETVDEGTGRLRTGAAFASCAGFLAHAIFQSRKCWRR